MNKDALIDVEISEDGMSAIVTACARPKDWDEPLTLELLKRLVKSAGVSGSLDPEATETFLERAAKGKNVKGTVIAKGVPPKEARDARIEFFGDMAFPVFQGNRFGKKKSARKAKDGRSVDGRPISPEKGDEPKDIEVSEKLGCSMDPETLDLYAKGYGRVFLREDKLVVRPQMKISEDKLRITATLFHKDFRGNVITLEQIKRALARVGAKTANDSAIAQALDAAARTKKPQKDVLVAVGRPPVHGKDGRFELKLKKSNSAQEDEESTENVDHRERSIFQSVKQGAVIGTIVLPKKGRNGVNVFGEIIASKQGRPVEVLAGENVSMEGSEFRALITGMISWTGERLSVNEGAVVDGDVDYSTGNIRAEKGSVKITGTVRGGFTVTAPGDVVVDGSVESASIESGGTVEVRGGVVMGVGETGGIQAKGDVRSQFAENAEIKAGGDVIITQNISNCDIQAGGSVICTRGKGIVQGGTTRASQGIEVNELGSELEVLTNVSLEFKLGNENQQIQDEREELEDRVFKIDNTLGDDDPKEILRRIP
ncbi:MAG: FapA family protein, partial [Thermodesulfobacteriota bacterium]|nr:FapA family protein [Thermodesulfobacteriota bacterium]